MSFIERLVNDYGFNGSCPYNLAHGYMPLQIETMMAHRLAWEHSKGEVANEVDLDMEFCDKFHGLSPVYPKVLENILSDPNGEYAQKCEKDWEDFAQHCWYYHDTGVDESREAYDDYKRYMNAHFQNQNPLNDCLLDHFIAGRVILRRVLEYVQEKASAGLKEGRPYIGSPVLELHLPAA